MCVLLSLSSLSIKNGLRSFCNQASRLGKDVNKCAKKVLGQPTFDTHPHIMNEGEVTPMITKYEYQTRRSKLIDSLTKFSLNNNLKTKNHMVIIPAASKQYMSDKIPYVFRQNTEFLYLTGCLEPDCCLVITIDERGKFSTVLFTRDKDDHAELWDGPRTHPEDATNFFGVSESLPISEFEKYIYSYQKSQKQLNLWYDFLTPVQKNIHSYIKNFMQDTSNKQWENPKPLLQKLRLYKSPAEIALMQKACDITADAFMDTISLSKPGIGENHLFAKFDYECRARGADYLAYPPVIAGGNRATTIHYINNNQIVDAGEMVLMDGGCEYHGYSSDVTRTWPVSGKFSKEQRQIYEVVYDVNNELIAMCNKFPSLDTLFESMCYLLGKRLQEVGLLGAQPSNNFLMKAAYQLCPHHVSHYLGMDIHDTPTVTRNVQIEPGMIITIEPGIYVNENNKLLPKQYRGIGIRIEDDILITENGPVVLSRKCPKHIDEIESIASENQ
ncbi:xaa-Pro aminopeptidase 3 [Diabrotica virgifera virgifera]|uniref:Xaa-Pro aminopeptidase 3 n=1 Tax=Diabrotica virgifera virgifera TaxID=50390 RepID=A0A6P7G909_DIAVI|nr:xaa-Pro aminopeptidase 3 [Diabrotica virgifera virgifera]